MKFDQWTFALTGIFGAPANVSVDPLPAPTNIKWGKTGPVGLSPDIKLVGVENEIVTDAFGRALSHLLQDQDSSVVQDTYDIAGKKPIETIQVTVANPAAVLQHGVDESYELELTQEKLDITSETIWGVLHAFTTLEQIVLNAPNGLVVEAPVRISDSPLYPYRGLHIDTSRNFYSVESLKRQIDALSLAKMNVFHWHLTDSQAWPIFVESFPQMTQDAYSSKETYSVRDVKEVVSYAKARGIRVIPELDMPGHSAAGWQLIDKDYLVCLNENWEKTAVQPTTGHLNILNSDMYEALEKIYNDVSKQFDDDFFHVGFDELNTGCYSTSQQTMDWINEGSHSWSDLAQYWVDRALPIFKKNRDNRRLMMWQDSVTSEEIPAHSIPTDVIMQVWSGGADHVKKLASMGYDVVISSANYLYLDCGYGFWIGNDKSSKNAETPSRSWCDPYKTWQRMYGLDLHANLTKEEAKHVIGGSVALWSEQTDSATVDGVVWPRSAALGELLWSGNLNHKGEYRVSELTQRILKFRELLVERGVNAAPLMPKWCLNRPGECDLSE